MCSQLTASQIVELFLADLVPLSKIHEYICYSAQYARTYTFENAVLDVELFDIHGRWFVSKAFIDRTNDNRPNPI